MAAPASADTWPEGHTIGVRHYCSDLAQMHKVVNAYARGDVAAGYFLLRQDGCNVFPPYTPADLIEPVSDQFQSGACVGRAWAFRLPDGRVVFRLLKDREHHQLDTCRSSGEPDGYTPAQYTTSLACFKAADARKSLEETFGETVVGRGVSAGGTLIELTANLETGSFTIVVVRPNGCASPVMTGNGWHEITPLLGDSGV